MRHNDPQPPDPPDGIPLPDPFIEPADFPAFPRGRWLAAVRSDAARAPDPAAADQLRAATAMAALIRPSPTPGVGPLPLILRHWVTFNGTQGQLGSSAAGPEGFMVDLLTWR